MGLTSQPTKTDGSIGRTKSNDQPVTDLDTQVPATEWETIKTFLIDACDEVGVHAGLAGDLNTRVTDLELLSPADIGALAADGSVVATGDQDLGGNALLDVGHLALSELGADPAAVADTGLVYTKDVSTVTELFYRDSAGNVVQLTSGGAGVGAVDSVFGRTGAVVAQSGDYAASLVDNDSGVPGADVAAALDNITLQLGYDQSADGSVVVDGTRGAFKVRDASTPIAGDLFAVQNNGGASYLRISTSETVADVRVRPANDNVHDLGISNVHWRTLFVATSVAYDGDEAAAFDILGQTPSGAGVAGRDARWLGSPGADGASAPEDGGDGGNITIRAGDGGNPAGEANNGIGGDLLLEGGQSSGTDGTVEVGSGTTRTVLLATGLATALQAHKDLDMQGNGLTSLASIAGSGSVIDITSAIDIAHTLTADGQGAVINPSINGTDLNWIGLRVDVDITDETVSGDPTRRLLECRTVDGAAIVDVLAVTPDQILALDGSDSSPTYSFINQPGTGTVLWSTTGSINQFWRWDPSSAQVNLRVDDRDSDRGFIFHWGSGDPLLVFSSAGLSSRPGIQNVDNEGLRVVANSGSPGASTLAEFNESGVADDLTITAYLDDGAGGLTEKRLRVLGAGASPGAGDRTVVIDV